jgi:hypothetical protein
MLRDFDGWPGTVAMMLIVVTPARVGHCKGVAPEFVTRESGDVNANDFEESPVHVSRAACFAVSAYRRRRLSAVAKSRCAVEARELVAIALKNALATNPIITIAIRISARVSPLSFSIPRLMNLFPEYFVFLVR